MNKERAAVAVHQLSAGYGKRTVLRDVAFSLPGGENCPNRTERGRKVHPLKDHARFFETEKRNGVDIRGPPIKKKNTYRLHAAERRGELEFSDYRAGCRRDGALLFARLVSKAR